MNAAETPILVHFLKKRGPFDLQKSYFWKILWQKMDHLTFKNPIFGKFCGKKWIIWPKEGGVPHPPCYGPGFRFF